MRLLTQLSTLGLIVGCYLTGWYLALGLHQYGNAIGVDVVAGACAFAALDPHWGRPIFGVAD